MVARLAGKLLGHFLLGVFVSFLGGIGRVVVGIFGRIGCVVHGITRIVGYYSRINNWNKSKLGELKDRHRGHYGLGADRSVEVPELTH